MTAQTVASIAQDVCVLISSILLKLISDQEGLPIDSTGKDFAYRLIYQTNSQSPMHLSMPSLKCTSQISLGRSNQTHCLVEEQNGNSHTPKQQDPIRDALRQETQFSRIEGMGNEGVGPQCFWHEVVAFVTKAKQIKLEEQVTLQLGWGFSLNFT
jgi:hypothetical protein